MKVKSSVIDCSARETPIIVSQIKTGKVYIVDIKYVLIDANNAENFDYVLPKKPDMSDNRANIGAVDEEGTILGSISYSLIGFEYVIDWLYVHPDVRLKGVGTGLVEEVKKAVVETGDRFPFSARFEVTEDDPGMHIFFLSFDDIVTEYSHERYVVKPEMLKTAPALQKIPDPGIRTEFFFDLPPDEQKKIIAEIDSEENYVVADFDMWKKRCVPELCRCAYSKDNLAGFIIMQELSNGNLELSYLYFRYHKGLFDLLSETASEIERLFPKVSLTFDAVSDESMKLAKRLFPDAQKVHVYEAQF